MGKKDLPAVLVHSVIAAIALLIASIFFTAWFPFDAESKPVPRLDELGQVASEVADPGCKITGPDGREIDPSVNGLIPRGATVSGNCPRLNSLK